ncbi:MAG TPA: hypothetical protein VF543_22355 [Pyrinomonadaceae bacterium]|jgi:hypothetical protein
MSKLEQAKSKLRFIGRTLNRGFIDAETLEELSRASFNALELLNEHEEETLQLPRIAEASTVVIYQPNA